MSDSNAPPTPVVTSNTPPASPAPVVTSEPSVATPASISSGATGADTAAIKQELQALYATLEEKISLAVAGQQFTLDTFETIVFKVVETIEELSASNVAKLTSAEKRNLALNLVQMVLADLHTKGKLSDSLYSSLNITLTFIAPTIFTAAAEAYSKLQKVEADVEKNGLKGCFKRNGC